MTLARSASPALSRICCMYYVCTVSEEVDLELGSITHMSQDRHARTQKNPLAWFRSDDWPWLLACWVALVGFAASSFPRKKPFGASHRRSGQARNQTGERSDGIYRFRTRVGAVKQGQHYTAGVRRFVRICTPLLRMCTHSETQWLPGSSGISSDALLRALFGCLLSRARRTDTVMCC